MSELWVRLGLIAGAVVVALVVSLVLRRRGRGRPITLGPIGLKPGVYLFSSATCLDCGPARRVIEAALGEDGFIEVGWEDDPAVFHELGVGAVPATVVVSENGSATLFPGQPGEALRGLNP